MSLRLVHSAPDAPTAPPCSSCGDVASVVHDRADRFHCGACNTAFEVVRPPTTLKVVQR
jgi:hypothetical protein